jgi:hypothetical protein
MGLIYFQMKSLISAVLLLLTFSAFGQIQNHAQWTFEAPKKEVKVGDVIEVKFNATIDANWYLYSSEFPAEDPIKTTFEYKKNETFEIVGKVKPIGFHNKEDEYFGTVSVAEGKASFVQKIKILKENPVIEGLIEGQTCTVKDGQCVLLKSDFKFPPIKVVAADTKKAELTPPQPITNGDQVATVNSVPADSGTSSLRTRRISLEFFIGLFFGWIGLHFHAMYLSYHAHDRELFY